MRLWDFLKERMEKYKNKIAFPQLHLRYSDILSFDSTLQNKKIVLCDKKSRSEQAVEILKNIACSNIIVPIANEYGENYKKNIVNTIKVESEKSLEDLAFIVFTSGTTGIPKGVMLTDENIISNLSNMYSYLDISEIQNICIARPLAHVAVLICELLYALCNGLSVWFFEESFMPQRVLSFLKKNKIELFCGTPTLYQALSLVYDQTELDLKIGVVSGERLTDKTGEEIIRSFNKVKFYNAYGLTEHSPRISVLSPQDFERKLGSVGKIINNIEFKVEDEELIVRSKSVMKGYYLDDKATFEKIKNGWLHTGDKVHFDEEGYLFIDGRKDNMIIKSGINIYPEEIEDLLVTNKLVSDCVVYSTEGRLGACICLDYIGDIDKNSIRKFLISNLNPNIVPQKINRVGKILVSSNGKKIRC